MCYGISSLALREDLSLTRVVGHKETEVIIVYKKFRNEYLHNLYHRVGILFNFVYLKFPYKIKLK